MTLQGFGALLLKVQSIHPRSKPVYQVLVVLGFIILLLLYLNFNGINSSEAELHFYSPSTDHPGHVSSKTAWARLAKTLPRLPSTKFYIRALNSNHARLGDSFDPHINSTDLEAMITLTWAFLDLCNRWGIRAMMYGGTLLGSYRHHGVMPWDDDVDFLLNEADKLRLRWAIKRNSSGLSLDTKWGRWKVWNRTGCLSKPRSYCWPFVDLSFYVRHGDRIYDTVSAFGWNYSYPVRLTFPTSKRPFMGRWLDSPRDALGFLGYDKTPSDQCISLTYSHRFEGSPKKPVVHRKCAALTRSYPFVVRLPMPAESSCDRQGLVEALRFHGGWHAYSLIVGEPSNAFNIEYTTIPIT